MSKSARKIVFQKPGMLKGNLCNYEIFIVFHHFSRMISREKDQLLDSVEFLQQEIKNTDSNLLGKEKELQKIKLEKELQVDIQDVVLLTFHDIFLENYEFLEGLYVCNGMWASRSIEPRKYSGTTLFFRY